MARKRRTENRYDALIAEAREFLATGDGRDRAAGVKPAPDEGPLALLEEAGELLHAAVEGGVWEEVAQAAVRLEQLAALFEAVLRRTETPRLRIYDPDAGAKECPR